MPSIAQLDVTFLLKNLTSSIIDQIDVHVIDSMSSKLINTTSANHISFPTISLFPHAQNYIHIYFTINAISFPQKLKTTLTYAINVSVIDGSASLSVTMDAFRNHPTHRSPSRSNSNSTYRARNTWERNLWIRERLSVLAWRVFHDVSSSQRCICRFDEFRNISMSIPYQYSII